MQYDGLILHQLIIGTVLIAATMLVHAVAVSISIWVYQRYQLWFNKPPHILRNFVALLSATLWLMVAVTIEVWIWAIAFIALRIFDTLEPAIYFALIIFTTLGFGDIVLDENWRILSGLGGANGFILFGVSTAYLIELFREIGRQQHLSRLPRAKS